MRITEDELIDIWRYFQYCCLPSIIMARYAYFDYIDDIKKEKKFYRHEVKQAINKIGRQLDKLPRALMDVSSQNVRYMNILGDNIDELLEEDKEELHRAIYITFKNARWSHVECYAALCYIQTLLGTAAVTFKQCCKDYQLIRGMDASELFHVYNIEEIASKWEELVFDATCSNVFEQSRKATDVDLQNLRCEMAIDAIRKKLSDIETLRTAMEKSYPWSPNYKEGVPYELSDDYRLVNSNKKEENDGMDKDFQGEATDLEAEQHHHAGA